MYKYVLIDISRRVNKYQRKFYLNTRRTFEQGKMKVNHKKFLGYDKDEEGDLIINEKQAKIVIRRICKHYPDDKG